MGFLVVVLLVFIEVWLWLLDIFDLFGIVLGMVVFWLGWFL